MRLLILALFIAGCGVKGKPQPPLETPTLGRGQPNFSKAAKKLRIDKSKKPVVTDEWDKQQDFVDEEEQSTPNGK